MLAAVCFLPFTSCYERRRTMTERKLDTLRSLIEPERR